RGFSGLGFGGGGRSGRRGIGGGFGFRCFGFRCFGFSLALGLIAVRFAIGLRRAGFRVIGGVKAGSLEVERRRGDEALHRSGAALFVRGERVVGEFLDLCEDLSAGFALVLVDGHVAIPW